MTLAERMLEKLTTAYNKALESNIGKLFRLYGESNQKLEDTYALIASWRDIDKAKGRTLDRIGAAFGVARQAASDAFYRLMIKVKITALLSGGDVDTIIEATSVLFNIPMDQIEVRELFPAKCQVIIRERDLQPEYRQYEAQVVAIIRRIISAGIGKEVLFRILSEISSPLYVGAVQIMEISASIPPYTPDMQQEKMAVYTGVALCAEILIEIRSSDQEI